LAENVLNESEKAFNQSVVYGRDTTIRDIITMARRFPMMSPLQLIIVKEAQLMKSFDGIEHYLEQPMQTTVLVFAYKYKKIDKRTRAGKAITEKCLVFESDKVREDKIPAWIDTFLSAKGAVIEPKAAVMLTEFLGNDLSKLSNELEKLLIILPGGTKRINTTHIEQNIGISKDFNNFELTNALTNRDVVKANRIIRYFGNNQRSNPYVLTISALFYYFSKILLYHGLKDKSRSNVAGELGINPYFVAEYQKAAQTFSLSKVRQIITFLREYDLKNKGGSTASEEDLLKELIYKILH